MKKHGQSNQAGDHVTVTSYVIGFVLSLALTFATFFLVQAHVASGHSFIADNILVLIILALAVVQLIVQMVFFLHLTSKDGRTWKLTIFFSTLILILIIVLGSVWIMDHLNYNMSSAQIEQYLQNEQGGF